MKAIPMMIQKKNLMSHKHSATVSVSLIAGVLFFGLAISTSALAEEIFWHDDGTGWEYGHDTQGRPTTTIHYRKDPYDWSPHKGGKEVRTYDPKTGAPIQNQFFNDKGVLQWKDVIDPETGDTTTTSYFDLDGNPKVTTQTSNNYGVREAALRRRGEYKEGWLDQFTKDKRSLSEGFNEWANQASDALEKWRVNVRDFLSGGSLGIKKESWEAPTRSSAPEPSQPPSAPPATGQWDFLKEYDPRDFIPEHAPSENEKQDQGFNTAPTFNNMLGSYNEPTPKEIDYNRYGDAVGFDPQRGISFVTNSKTGEITYFYPRHDDQFKDPQGGTNVVTMLNGKVVHEDNYDHLGELMAPVPNHPTSTEKKKTTPEERQKLYDKMNEQYEREERDKRYDEMIKEYDARQEREKRYNEMIERYEREQREKRYDKMIEGYERQERDKRYDQMIEEEQKKKNKKSKSESSAETKSAFSSFDALQQGGLGMLNTTPTAALDGVSGRDMTTNLSGNHGQPKADSKSGECEGHS